LYYRIVFRDRNTRNSYQEGGRKCGIEVSLRNILRNADVIALYVLASRGRISPGTVINASIVREFTEE
jgi:hypothetical protein